MENVIVREQNRVLGPRAGGQTKRVERVKRPTPAEKRGGDALPIDWNDDRPCFCASTLEEFDGGGQTPRNRGQGVVWSGWRSAPCLPARSVNRMLGELKLPSTEQRSCGARLQSQGIPEKAIDFL